MIDVTILGTGLIDTSILGNMLTNVTLPHTYSEVRLRSGCRSE